MIPYLIHEAATTGSPERLAAQALMTSDQMSQGMAIGLNFAVGCSEDCDETCATDCDTDFAYQICHVCEDQGRAVCFQSLKEECHQVAARLRSKGLQVEVDDY